MGEEGVAAAGAGHLLPEGLVVSALTQWQEEVGVHLVISSAVAKWADWLLLRRGQPVQVS